MINTREELPLKKLIQRLIEEDEEEDKQMYSRSYASTSYRNLSQLEVTDQLSFYMSFMFWGVC